MILDHKFDLGFFPTPLHRIKNLSEKYAPYHIFIKRDDQTGLASGGNKTRKLEYLIQEALENGCDTVITAGAQQSNHCRQTAAACAIAKLKCHLLLGGTAPQNYNGNLLLSHLLGAQIHFTVENRKGEDIYSLKNKLELEGKKPFIIPYGGSNITGALGFVNAVKELKTQLIAQNLKIDYLFFASSSGGTQAGLTLGNDLYNLNMKLIPIGIDKSETQGLSLEEVVLHLVNEGKLLLNLKKEYTIDEVKINNDYNEAGYGVITENEKGAIKELAENEGILLDPVYTGRAFYAMMDYLKKNKIRSNANILFWHTGGFPANFYYADQLK
ncbi:MAG: D-cysteine desulfhydrase [Flavobacteria bacterium RIFCSPLOWO2_12_FULL_35_11]|nr:MAG: D-cysteine desulfhydrase [Flavobacteria bacterium RIFCSPLOWO2_12_FULL_35_11]